MSVSKALSVILLLVVASAAAVFFYTRTAESPQLPEPAAPPMSTEAPAAPSGASEALPEPSTAPPAQSETSAVAEPSYVVMGVVSDKTTGAPIADASITTQPISAEPGEEGVPAGTEGEETPSAQSDATGAFELRLNPNKGFQITCNADGFVSASQQAMPGATGDVRMDFQLQPGATVSGKVTDAATGAGIADGQVFLVMTNSDTKEVFASLMHGKGARATTTEDGSYTIKGAAPGAYTVRVSARQQGYLPKPNGVQINLGESQALAGIDFKLERGAAVEGVVTDAASKPVEGAHIQLMPAKLMDEMGQTGFESMMELGTLAATSDTEGKYAIQGLDYGKEYRLVAKKDGTAGASSPVFSVAKGKSPARMDLKLTNGAKVSGKVVFEDGAAAADTKLILMPDFGAAMTEGFGTEPRNATSDASGAFAFEHVGAGKYLIMSSGAGPFSGKQTAVECDGVKDVADLVVTIQKEKEKAAAGAVSGRVVNAAGAPVQGAKVEALLPVVGKMGGGMTATSAADGAFKIDLPPMTAWVSVEASKDGESAKSAMVMSGAEVTLTLRPGATITGVVLDAQGNAAADCTVSLKKVSNDESESDPLKKTTDLIASMTGQGGNTVQTDAGGNFSFTGLEADTYTIRARSKTQGSADSTPLTLAEGEKRENERLTLAPNLKVSGIVKNSQGQPVAGAALSLSERMAHEIAEVSMQFMPNAGRPTATSDASGAFTFDNVAPGEYSITATHTDYARVIDRGLVVQAGQDVTGYEIVMRRGGALHGNIIEDGQPQQGVMVQLLGSGGMYMTTSNAQGVFDIQNIAPGSYLLQMIDMSRMQGEGAAAAVASRPQRTVDIVEGQTLDLTTEQAQGVSVTGTVTGEGLGDTTFVVLRGQDTPRIPDSQIATFDQLISQARAVTGRAAVTPNGQFELRDIPPGTYTMMVFSLDLGGGMGDIAALQQAGDTPRFSQVVTVGKDPVTVNIQVPAQADTPEGS